MVVPNVGRSGKYHSAFFGGSRVGMDLFWEAWAIIVPCFFGVAVAVAEMYVFERKIPFLGSSPGRGASWNQLIGAFLLNLAYAAPIAHWVFVPTNSRQYFMAAVAAVETFGGRTQKSKLNQSSSAASQAEAASTADATTAAPKAGDENEQAAS